MIKFLTTLTLFLVSTIVFSQSAFDKFENDENVTAVIVNKKMFEMMGKMKMDASDKQAQQFMSLVKKLDNLKVFVTSNAKVTNEMKTATDRHLKNGNLEELMRITEGGKSVKIHFRPGAKDTQVKELFMFIEGGPKDKETVLLSLTGDFDLNDISLLTEKMNLPGGDDLKKASTKGKK
ncbi:DUF4252 domain-containing protein [Flavobacterium orientale]|uniref:DUF4252 domain-containing protein n=1 Tax=Flavobacterium orientale TaxID=1756020 RepID=A0A916Y3E4_9FLAO|nr:DUF4252 domain-containing protein [Flavobacterium orientale]GGD29611.1 hypothetical protein GCM10011343_19750 [Flavobacterium orientale]